MEWELVAGVLGGIVLLGNAMSVLSKWISPAISTKERIEKIEREIAELQKHEKNDLEALERIEAANIAQCQAMLCLINHMIDGNGICEMKKTRDEIQELILQKL